MTKRKVVKEDFRTQENADTIFDLMGNGESLRSICRDNDWKLTTIYDWLKRDYAEQYARAKQDRAEFYADEIIEIADDKTIKAEDKRVMVDARKWIACKMLPKVYGDKLSLDGGLEMNNKHIFDGITKNDVVTLARQFKK